MKIALVIFAVFMGALTLRWMINYRRRDERAGRASDACKKSYPASFDTEWPYDPATGSQPNVCRCDICLEKEKITS
jgi:hypothetical protein